jgi:hypothetical protein
MGEAKEESAMQSYEERKQSRIESLKKRAIRKKEIASENDLSLYGEEKSCIPLGQPILVGHHSERRHRKHLERIENRVRKGYEAHKESERLLERAEAAEKRSAIDSDNPNAIDLLKHKIEAMEKQRDQNKKINQLVRAASNSKELESLILNQWPDFDSADLIASKLMDGREKGVPTWWFTNHSAEIRRLKKRIEQLQAMEENQFPTIEKNGITVCLLEGRIVMSMDFIPSKESRQKLKSSPLSFKWSPKNKAWVRKHTPTTASQYFKSELNQFLEGVTHGE